MKSMAERKFDLISPNIKAYLRNRVKYLTCNPEYFIRYGSMTKSKIEEEANRHSVSIELVAFDESTSEAQRKKMAERKRCQKNLREAREWALVNYSFPLTRGYVEIVGSMVEPITNDNGFRTEKIRISGAMNSPPSPEKLDREFTIFLWEHEGLEDPLERAIHAHFGIARVHPFNDGNGRTARLVQDVILAEQNLPFPMIPLYERPEYIQKIQEAIASYCKRESEFNPDLDRVQSQLNELATHSNELSPNQVNRGRYLARVLLSTRITPEQNAFYDFIALKVLNGLSIKLKHLYESKHAMERYFKNRRKARAK